MLTPTDARARKATSLQPDVDAIVIGASAGAIEALGVLLPALPATLSAPVIVVVHLPSNHPSLLTELFRPRCALRVREAEDKQAVEPGTVWFAPPGYHLLVERDRSFALSVDEPVHFSRPSIDVLFESAVDAYRARLLGLVLTGASQDGASGAARIRDAGGWVGVQEPATALASTMPEVAIARARPQCVGTLTELTAFVLTHAEARLP